MSSYRFASAAGRSAWTAQRVPHGVACVLATLAGLFVLGGCQHPEVTPRTEARERSLTWVLDTLIEEEQSAGQRLERAGEFVQEDLEHDQQRSAQNVQALRAYFEFDLRHWDERQRQIGEDALERFSGTPEDIERTAIVLFL